MVVSDYRFSSALTRTSFGNMEQIANHIALAQWPALPDCLFLQQNIRLKSIVLDFYTTRFLWVLLHNAHHHKYPLLLGIDAHQYNIRSQR